MSSALRIVFRDGTGLKKLKIRRGKLIFYEKYLALPSTLNSNPNLLFMKKIFLAVTALFLSTGAFAQHFEYGIKGGLNQAYYTNESETSGSRTGLHIGVLGEYVFNRNIGIQAELLYSMQGGRYMYDGGKYTDKLDFINLPILAKIYFSRSRMWSVDLGPQFGYMINAKVNGSDIYNSPEVKKFDASLCLGISYKFASGLELSIRGTSAFTEVFTFSNARLTVSQIIVGYRF